MSERLEGLAATKAMFDALPDAARKELSETLADVGKVVLAAQEAQAPVDSGTLKAALTIQLAIASLAVRVGLFDLRKGKDRPWYAPIVYYGRRAQTVNAHRLGTGGRAAWRKMVREGRARLSRKPLSIGKVYPLHVGATAPNPFLDVDLDGASANRLASFWSNTFAAAGVGE